MDRRAFLRNSALITSGVVAADQLELLDRLGWVRRFFPSAAIGRTLDATSHIVRVDGGYDSVCLPAAMPGIEIVVVNHGAAPLRVFGRESPAPLNARLEPASVEQYVCTRSRRWARD